MKQTQINKHNVAWFKLLRSRRNRSRVERRGEGRKCVGKCRYGGRYGEKRSEGQKYKFMKLLSNGCSFLTKLFRNEPFQLYKTGGEIIMTVSENYFQIFANHSRAIVI